MGKIGAIIFDIDGTAIDSPSQRLPSQRLKNAVKAIEDKYYICAATGRTWATGQAILQSMGLVDPCIISGGSQICDPQTGTILWQCNLEFPSIKAIKEALLQHPGYGLVINNFTEHDYFEGGFPPNELDTDQEVYFADYVFVPEDVARQVADDLDRIEGIAYSLGTSQKTGLKDIHMMNVAATKEHAVAELLIRIHIHRDDTYGFGDAMNDVPLFKAVHTKIAVGNASPALKEMANEIIPQVSEDGFAQYLERLV